MVVVTALAVAGFEGLVRWPLSQRRRFNRELPPMHMLLQLPFGIAAHS